MKLNCVSRCPNYNLPTECYLMRAGGDCCPQPMCRNPDGSTINPLTSPSSQYPVYGTYPGGFTGFRPGYTQPFATGSNSFSNQSSKFTIVSVSHFNTGKSLRSLIHTSLDYHYYYF